MSTVALTHFFSFFLRRRFWSGVFMVALIAFVIAGYGGSVLPVHAQVTCSLALNASPDSIGPDQSSSITLSSSPVGALFGGTMTAYGNSSAYSFVYFGGTSATVTASHYANPSGVNVTATGWSVAIPGAGAYPCSDGSTTLAVGGGVTNCQLNSQGTSFVYINQTTQIQVSSNVPVTGWNATVGGAGTGGAGGGGQYGIFVNIQAGNVPGTITVDATASPLNSSGTCRPAHHQISVLAPDAPPPPPDPNPPPPGGSCPTGVTPSLASSTIPVGGQTTVSPPAGWSSGGLFSNSPGVATITVLGGAWVVTGISAGTAAIYGTNWSTSGGAWPCNLSNVYITVGAAAPGDTAPIGYVSSMDTSGSNCWVGGWAFDPDTPAQSIVGHVYVNGPAGTGIFVSAFNVNEPSPAGLNAAFGITGDHGYTYTIPNAYRDGTPHTFYLYSINTNSSGSNPQMTNYTPAGIPDPLTVTCTTAAPTAQLWVSLHGQNNWVKSITVTPGTSLDYKWSSTNGSTYSSTYSTGVACGGYAVSGNWVASSASGQYLDAIVPACPGLTYLLNYSVNSGAATDSVTVVVTSGTAPTLALSANGLGSPPTVNINQGTSLNLTWTVGGGAPSSNCTPSSSPTVNAWNTSSKGTASGSQVLNGLVAGTYTFSLSCSNAAGIANASVAVQVNVVPPQPANLLSSNHDVVAIGAFSAYLPYDYQTNADADVTSVAPIGDGETATLAVHIRNTGVGSVSGNMTLTIDLFNLAKPTAASGWNPHIYCADSSMSTPTMEAPNTCNSKYQLGGDAATCAANSGQPAYNATTNRLTFVLCPVGGQTLEGLGGMNLISVRYTAQIRHPAGSVADIFRFKSQAQLTYFEPISGNPTTQTGLYLNTPSVIAFRNLSVPFLLER